MAAAKKRKGLASNPFASLGDLRDGLPDATVPVAKHDDLEAQIAESPEDPDRYLVYGDVLQAAGDPRGTLIALHHAILSAKAKDRTAKREAAEKFIDDNRHYFLGSLGAVTPRTTPDDRSDDELELEWFLGFIRHAKISAGSTARAIELITALFALPSARFLRELEIVMMTTSFSGIRSRSRAPISEADAGRIVDCLLQIGNTAGQKAGAKAAQTLRRLQLPVLGGFVAPRSLYDAFPLLKHDPASAWEEAITLADKPAKRLRAIALENPLPPLEPKSGVKLTIDVEPARIVRALKAEVDKRHPLGVVEAMTDAFTNQSLDAFSLALAREIGGLVIGAPTPPNLVDANGDGIFVVQDNNNEPDADDDADDAADAAAPTAVAREPWAFDLMGRFGGDACVTALYPVLARLTHGRAIQALRVLRRIESGIAICAMYALAKTPRRVLARRREANSELAALAENREITIEQLVDRACANPGYLAMQQDPTVYETSPAVTDARRLWLNDRMLSGHPWGVDEFRAIIQRRSRDVTFLRALVFRHVASAGEKAEKADRFFRLDRDGVSLDVNDAAYELERGSISIAHPVELAASNVLEAWNADMVRRSRIRQPILQLTRPIFALTEDEKNATTISERYSDRSRSYLSLINRLERAEWGIGGLETISLSENENYRATWFTKRFPRGGHTIAVRLDGQDVGAYHLSVLIDARHTPQFRVLDPVDASELLADLDRVTS